MTENIPQVEKRRILKKVRLNFINKTPENDEQNLIVPVPPLINPDSFNMIDQGFGIIEKNRKMYFGAYYTQSNLRIANINIEDILLTKTVTINFQPKYSEGLFPLENGIKRLESYGDLGLATWGWKIKNHYMTYPVIIENYLKMLQSNDPIIISKIKKAKNQANLLIREIESKYAYQKVVYFLDKSSPKLMSASYCKGMIELIGFDVDEFVNSVKKDGLPHIFKGNSSMYMGIMKAALDHTFISTELVNESPEVVVDFYDKDGIKKEITAQNFIILDIVPEGIFATGFVIIKRVGKGPEKKICFENVVEDENLKMKKPAEGNSISDDSKTGLKEEVHDKNKEADLKEGT